MSITDNKREKENGRSVLILIFNFKILYKHF